MDPAALFARLQLRPDADEREVRRAYARELKKIDQEAQPEAFQELRETYDQLLWWLKRRHAEAEQAEAAAQEQPEGTASPEPQSQAPAQAEASGAASNEAAATQSAAGEPPSSPEALGREVLDLLIAQLGAQGWNTRDEAEDALVRLLDDPRFINVDARRYFEWGVAQILASGWRPGHDFLFAPATELFGWDDDRSRLLWFGRAGQIVDAAIEEMALFDTQEWPYRERQKEVIRRTRDPARPSARQLIGYLPVAEMVVSHFPNWLHVIAMPGAVAQWKEWDKETPGWRRKLVSISPVRLVKVQPGPEKKRAKKAGISFTLVFFLLMGIGVLNAIFKTDTNKAPVSTYQGFNPPALDGSTPPPASARLLPEKRVSTEPLPRGIKQDADPAQARIDAAFLAKKKPNAELCMDASDLARMNPDAHRRGELGQKFDALIMDCLVRKLAVMHTDAFEPSYKREQARMQKEMKAMLERPVQGLPSPAVDASRFDAERFRTPQAPAVPSYKFVPDKPSPAAVEPPRLVSEPNGTGLKYEIKDGEGRMSARP